jgi:hypothetical protein
VLRHAVLLAWQAARVSALALLITLEPVVRFVLSTVALLLLLTALFFRALGTPHFPFWGMLSFAIGCTLLLMAYYGVMRIMSNPQGR